VQREESVGYGERTPGMRQQADFQSGGHHWPEPQPYEAQLTPGLEFAASPLQRLCRDQPLLPFGRVCARSTHSPTSSNAATSPSQKTLRALTSSRRGDLRATDIHWTLIAEPVPSRGWNRHSKVSACNEVKGP